MIPIRILSDKDIKSILDIQNTLACVEKAYVMKSNHQAKLFPLISEDIIQGRAEMDIKSGILHEDNVFGLKLVSWFGDNEKLGLPSLTGLTMLFDLKNGFPRALLNARYLTGMRTGAAGAVGVNYLAKQDSKVLLVVGTGVQAIFQIAATLSKVTTIDKVYLFNALSYEDALKFQGSINAELSKISNDINDLGNSDWIKRIESVEFTPVNHLAKALEEADAVITVTPSRKALILKEWVKPGTHFSCIGADMLGKQEIDEKIFDKAIVYTDDIPQATTVGETQHPIKNGIININNLNEIGHLIQGKSKGRVTDKDITIFDSTGIALQDLVVSKYLVSKADEMNLGTIVEI